MDQTFFLAANSGQGFYSLYDGFPGAAQLLHIIKGGPGTGKSGFLKRIRGAAWKRGMDTLSVLCSGDPNSLDGLLVPTLGQAWVDGTAPHVREPELFGVDADYVNLGRFCRLPLTQEERERALALKRANQACYQTAYGQLAAAAAFEQAEEYRDAAVTLEEEKRMRALLETIPERKGGRCRRERRFLSAVTGQGEIFLHETLDALCKQKAYFRGGSAVLEQAAALAEKRTKRLILCPRPLRPEQLEAVLLPEEGIALLRAPAALLVPQGERLMSREALRDAVEKLREAKTLHDRLESVYRPHMDFDALNAWSEEYVNRLFA